MRRDHIRSSRELNYLVSLQIDLSVSVRWISLLILNLFVVDKNLKRRMLLLVYSQVLKIIIFIYYVLNAILLLMLMTFKFYCSIQSEVHILN